MGKHDRITVDLAPEMALALRAAVAQGRYSTMGDIVREAIQDWQDTQSYSPAELTALRAALREGEEGEGIAAEVVFAEVREIIRSGHCPSSKNSKLALAV